MSRRRVLANLFSVATLFSLTPFRGVIGQSGNSQREIRDMEMVERGMAEEARRVEELYSSRSLRVKLGGHEYLIPANFFGPKGLNLPDVHDADRHGGYFGFFLFLPDYSGYTKENWRDRFDRRLVSVLQVSAPAKSSEALPTDKSQEATSPGRQGDPRSRFNNVKSLYEATPAFELYGLAGYRRRGGGTRGDVLWAGTRDNGEFFFFHSSIDPNEQPGPDIPYPYCTVQHYSKLEELFIAYRYSQEHIARWREIDNAIWSKLHHWRVKLTPN